MLETSALDGYTFKARYLPALIVVLPAWLAFALWFPPEKLTEGAVASAAVTLVLGVLLAQLGRDAGRSRQKSLFTDWGGAPTIRALSFRDGMLNPITMARCHGLLNKLIPGIELPVSGSDELADVDSARKKYESASDYLRNATRDKRKFRLVYAENVNFGFRRNLWAMKPAGIAIASLGMVTTIGHACRTYLNDDTVQGAEVASSVLCITMLALWLLRFTKEWVKVSADAYALQLVSAAESLSSESDA